MYNSQFVGINLKLGRRIENCQRSVDIGSHCAKRRLVWKQIIFIKIYFSRNAKLNEYYLSRFFIDI